MDHGLRKDEHPLRWSPLFAWRNGLPCAPALVHSLSVPWTAPEPPSFHYIMDWQKTNPLFLKEAITLPAELPGPCLIKHLLERLIVQCLHSLLVRIHTSSDLPTTILLFVLSAA